MFSKSPLLSLASKSQAFIICTALLLAISTYDSGGDYQLIIYTLVLLVGLVFSHFYSLKKTNLRFPRDKGSLFLLASITWLFFTNLWSPVLGNSFYEAIPMLFLLLACLLGFWSNSSKRNAFQYFLIAILLATLWLGCYQSFVLYPTLHARGFFLNRNSNAIFICMILLPFAAQYLSDSKKSFSQPILGLIVFICSFILSLTLCRGAVLGLLAGLALLYIHTVITNQAKTKFFTLLVTLLAGYICGIVLNGAEAWSHVFERTLSPDLNEMSSGRLEIWESTWMMFLDKPLFGWGYNMFRWLYPHYQLANTATPMHFAHNDFLQLLMELGLVGLCLFLTSLFFFTKQFIRTYPQLALHQQTALVGYSAACVALLTHALLTFNLYQPSLLLLLGLYLGYALRISCKINPRESFLFVPGQSKYITSFGYYSIVISIVISVGYFSFINIYTTRLVFSSHKNNLDSIIRAEKATQLQPSRELYFILLSNAYVNFIEQPTQELSLETKVNFILQALKYTDIAIQKNPYQSISFINKIHLNSLLPSKLQLPANEIQQTFERLIYIDPKNFNARLNYAKFLMSIKQPQKAAKILHNGLKLSAVGNIQSAINFLKFCTIVFKTNTSLISNINNEILLLSQSKVDYGLIEFKSLQKF